MRYETLLIDSSYLAYQIFFSPLIISQDSTNTRMVYGFLTGLMDLYDMYPVNTLVVVWDRGHEAKDRIYPQYKRSHNKVLTAEQRCDFEDQFNLLNSFLQWLNIKCCFASGAEADDVIAHLCTNGSATVLGEGGKHIGTITIPKPILIVSGDHDMYPLLSDKVSIWKSRKQKLYTVDSFVEDFPSLEPWQYTEMLALMGCSSDNVPGVKGIGPKYALRLILKYGSVANIKKATDDDSTAARVRDHWDAVKLSYRLVQYEKVNPVITQRRTDFSRARKQLFALGIDALVSDWPNIIRLSEL